MTVDIPTLITQLRTARPDSPPTCEQLAVVAEAVEDVASRSMLSIDMVRAYSESEQARRVAIAERDAAVSSQVTLLQRDLLTAERDAAREQLAKVTAERDEARRQADTVVHNLRETGVALNVASSKCALLVDDLATCTSERDTARAECTRLAQELDAVVAWLEGLSRDDDYSADYRRALADVAADLASGAWKEGK